MTTEPNQTPPNLPRRGFKGVVYAISIFIVFMALTYVLRLISGKYPEKTILFGVYQSTDLWLGATITVILTYSRYLKRNIGKK